MPKSKMGKTMAVLGLVAVVPASVMAASSKAYSLYELSALADG